MITQCHIRSSPAQEALEGDPSTALLRARRLCHAFSSQPLVLFLLALVGILGSSTDVSAGGLFVDHNGGRSIQGSLTVGGRSPRYNQRLSQ
jgi:hypothetical protein